MTWTETVVNHVTTTEYNSLLNPNFGFVGAGVIVLGGTFAILNLTIQDKHTHISKSNEQARLLV
jgi:hypothetical protein